MSDRGSRERDQLSGRLARRELLDRDQLLALVEELHATVTDQQATIDRQRAAITRLQRDNGVVTATAPSSSARQVPRPGARPVPGSDFTVVFDGGAIGNPGRGYGTYQIVGGEGLVTEQRLEYGDNVTNNQAEFLTIIRALEDLRSRLTEAASTTPIAIRGDSQLVINTIAGRWKARHPGLVPLYQEAVALLRQFGQADIAWQPRSKSVAVLGH